ncbi:MAG: hypothetical protein ACSHXL_00270 [Bacteroidota bacterium]
MADDISLVVGVDYSELTGLVKTTDQTKRALGLMAKEFAKSGSQKNYMAGINKLVAAQKNLDKSARLSRSQIMKLGNQMKKEADFTNALTSATKNLNVAQGTSAKVMQQTKNRMNGNNMAIQQLGYQFGDFAVQVQGGTSAFVAFSQQGSQLAGILPMIAGPLGLSMGAAVGLSAALGILIPIGSAVGRMFFEMSEEAEKAKESADSLANRMKSLTQSLYDYAAAKQAAEKGMTLDQILANTALGNVDQRKRDIADLRKEIEGLQSSIAASSEPKAEIKIDPAYANIGVGRRRSSSTQLEATAPDIQATSDRVELRLKEEALAEKLKELELATLPIKLLQQQAQEKAVLLQREYVRDAENKAALDQIEVQYGSESAELAKLRLELSVQSYARKVAELDVNEKLKLSLIEQYRKSKESEAWSLANQETLNTLHEQAQMFLAGEAEAQAAARAEAEKYLTTVTDLEAKIGEAGVDALLLAGVDIESGIDAATIAAGKLAGKLSISLQEALELIKLSNDPLSAFGGAGEFIPTYYPEDKKKTKGGGGGKSPQEKLAEFLTKKKEEADLQSQLVGLFGEERDLKSELIKFEQEYGKVALPRQAAEFEATLQQIAADKERQKVLEEAKAQQEGLAQSIANSMGDAFMSVIDGTASVKDAFKSMAAAIIKELLQVLVIQRLVGSVGGGGTAGTGIAGWLSKTLPSANGNVFSGGSHVQAYANGGVVGGPTLFPMSGGKTGLMGEAGPEAIMPLKRGANGKLGVQMEGGGGDNVVINQSFNFQANGDESVKKLIAQAAPKIAQMTKSSMLDDRRRGGQTKSVFG